MYIVRGGVLSNRTGGVHVHKQVCMRYVCCINMWLKPFWTTVVKQQCTLH